MKKKGVIEAFFQFVNSHVEVLRQGLDVLIFLAQNDELHSKQLDLLWDNSLGIHEHDKNIIYSSLIELSTHVGLKQIDHLFGRIYSTPPTEYDSHVLELIRNFTEITIKANVSYSL